MSRIRVLIADDHAMVREGLARLICDQPDMQVVAEAADGEQALSASCAHEPQVVLLDMRLPGIGGVTAIQRLRAACPRTRILVLSMYEDASYVRAARAAGAHGYVGKRASADALVAAVRALHAGEGFITATLDGGIACEQGPTIAFLSAREREVLRLLVRGHTGREMAFALGISKSSADTYRARVFRKLGIDTRAELVARVADDPELLSDLDPGVPRRVELP
jgi:DNA-binding NarL/FixJ family response regulator